MINRYDDPRWYEENYPEHGSSAAQNSQAQSANEDSTIVLSREAGETDFSTPVAINTDKQPFPRYARFKQLWERFLVIAPFLIIAFSAGWFGHQLFTNILQSRSNQSQTEFNLIQQAWDDIDKNYVDRKHVDYQKMAYTAIQAMTQTLGDAGHSRFMTPKQVKGEDQSLQGNMVGIGIYIIQDPQTKQVTIGETIPNSPAEKAGFQHGDVIVAVNGTSTQGKDVNGVSSLIRGPAGTNVTLTIQRANEAQTRDIHVTRAQFQVPSVIMHSIPETHIAHIQVAQFANGVTKQLQDALKQAKAQGATKIILDLRGNPGGLFDEAVETASLFIKSGNVLLEEDKNGKRTPVSVKGHPLDTSSQMVVLIDGGSASAAEIVSGALEDNHRATLLGEKTFGTGTVLLPFSLTDGSELYLGTQEWLTPNGQFIRQDPSKPNSGGIKPDITVTQGANAPVLTPNEENQQHLTEQQILDAGDTQLSAAIQYLTK